MKFKNIRISIIGLGYVGLPLAVEFGKKFPTLGFDINKKRIFELKRKIDKTKEVAKSNLSRAKNLKFTNKIDDIKKSNVFIVTVPTPIDKNKKPNLSYLLLATKIVAKNLKKNDIVIYESTVYPGTTEEILL